ncbi:SDR family oxidoreductase [Henriciella barbarensis]|uniref:SDR family oxidoreductase n=1 Tax=Henriciella barbarensis TaxID=86342 RepID=A0A399R386_9PROT|nr:SDR family oxidoreductase [Henriciella barbarensis]RIJ23979.1 SDR family oxidoreductase [Henriciella barbarensis]
MKTVVITGASTGIGRTAAEHLAAQGWKVFAGVRKQEDADALARANPAIEPLMLDVTKSEDVEAAVVKVSEALGGAKLAGLVNNAGIANMGPLALQPADEFKAHFEVNVFGTLNATQGFLPLLGTDRNRSGEPGRIVNITSLGGRIAAPFLGAYTATKHAVESMTDSFRRELIIYGIDAIAIGPGSVKTPIWDKAEDKNENQPYANSAWAEPISKFSDAMLKGGREGLPPERIAEVIETALIDSSPKARYAPVPNKFTNWTIPTHIPKRWLDSIFANRFGMQKPD